MDLVKYLLLLCVFCFGTTLGKNIKAVHNDDKQVEQNEDLILLAKEKRENEKNEDEEEFAEFGNVLDKEQEKDLEEFQGNEVKRTESNIHKVNDDTHDDAHGEVGWSAWRSWGRMTSELVKKELILYAKKYDYTLIKGIKFRVKTKNYLTDNLFKEKNGKVLDCLSNVRISKSGESAWVSSSKCSYYLPPPPKQSTCTVPVNVGFLLDSSASLGAFFQTEKDFLKHVVEHFHIDDTGSRASVITFGKKVDFSIKFNEGTKFGPFAEKVDAIPFMRSYTYIDRAMTLALNEMFDEANGALLDRPNVLILLTDGKQSKREKYTEPSILGKKVRKQGIVLICVGIGDGVDSEEIKNIAGHPKRAFHAKDFDHLMAFDFIESLTTTSCEIAKIPSMPKCDKSVNVGFILDSSASLGTKYYKKEKHFMEAIAEAFDIIKDGSKASVVTFSKHAYLDITFNEGNDEDLFNDAVNALPFLRSYTRIDRALRLAQTKMFTARNGYMPTRPKVLFLITDGRQSRGRGHENPAIISKQMRGAGVVMVTVGIGDGVSKKELIDITGDPTHVFLAKNFDELMGWPFIRHITRQSCDFTHLAQHHTGSH